MTALLTRRELAQIAGTMIVIACFAYGLSQAGRVAVGFAMDVWALFN